MSLDVTKMSDASLVVVLSFRGAITFSDVLSAGDNKQRQHIFDIQDRLQFDDAVNIQFTSVRCNFRMEKIVLSK